MLHQELPRASTAGLPLTKTFVWYFFKLFLFLLFLFFPKVALQQVFRFLFFLRVYDVFVCVCVFKFVWCR